MCQQLYVTYTSCTHTYVGRKERCEEAGLPTKYREYCKPRTEPVAWRKYRISEERREEKAGICPDCAISLQKEMVRLFRGREQAARDEEDAEKQGKARMAKEGKVWAFGLVRYQ
ncbi:uncharacterized protein N7482_007911 [Penicillium canariense]|uniref:Uncharacterized protein n=1 Tax=Penicillium canariense TaxID=189055 RepID=A0A9W9LJM2_9EURO|nr:uncharacterized protein N7482_007911 [Penicillium canariense]KAJ5160907.1 hypothetical protein N7482_007911 [Penicillium canariense]